MTADDVSGNGGKKKARRAAAAVREEEASDASAIIHCARSGEWLPAAELRNAVLEALDIPELTLDFAELDHLDAGALQIVLALANQRRGKGLSLQWVNTSPPLSQWLEYAGASAHLSAQLPEPS